MFLLCTVVLHLSEKKCRFPSYSYTINPQKLKKIITPLIFLLLKSYYCCECTSRNASAWMNLIQHWLFKSEIIRIMWVHCSSIKHKQSPTATWDGYHHRTATSSMRSCCSMVCKGSNYMGPGLLDTPADCRSLGVSNA